MLSFSRKDSIPEPVEKLSDAAFIEQEMSKIKSNPGENNQAKLILDEVKEQVEGIEEDLTSLEEKYKESMILIKQLE